MEDSLILSIGYLGNLERVSQGKRSRILTSCYVENQFLAIQATLKE